MISISREAAVIIPAHPRALLNNCSLSNFPKHRPCEPASQSNFNSMEMLEVSLHTHKAGFSQMVCPSCVAAFSILRMSCILLVTSLLHMCLKCWDLLSKVTLLYWPLLSMPSPNLISDNSWFNDVFLKRHLVFRLPSSDQTPPKSLSI